MSTKIEWATKVWNVTSGCDKVSPGCENCYAINMSNRLSRIEATKERYAGSVKKTKGGKLNWSGEIKCHTRQLGVPYHWKNPQRVFVNSMSDLFHENVPFDFISQVFGAMKRHDRHVYMLLTKRPERALEFLTELYKKTWWKDEGILGNVWIGTSAENQEQANNRIPYLLHIPAAVRFLSCEPLLGPIDFYDVVIDGQFYHTLKGFGDISPGDGRKINWVIAGGESGHNARPMHPDWVRSLRDQCQAAKVPFFFKQWGEWIDNQNYDWQLDQNDYKTIDLGTGWFTTTMHRVGKKAAGRLLDGLEHNAFPFAEGG